MFSNPKGQAEPRTVWYGAQWMTLAVCGAFYNPNKATCGESCVACYGYSDAEVEADPFSVAVNGTVQLNAQATYADGPVDYFTASSSWASNSTPVATVGASTGLVAGVSPGSVAISAQLPTPVVYTGEICTEGCPVPCPTGILGAGTSGSVDSATISSPVQTVDGSTTPSFSVTTGGNTPTSYAWSFTAASGAGDSPNVTFNPNNQATTTTNSHWYALPNTTCTASTSAAYTIIVTVTFPDSVTIAPQTTLTVILVAEAGYEAPVFQSGLPSIAQNSQGVWVVTGQGNLERVVSSPVIYYATTSQFYNKVYAHENEHYVQWTTGMLSNLYVISNLMTQLSPLIATTQAALQNEITETIASWNATQSSAFQSLKSAAEAQAYQVSDPIAPQYIYQSTCGATGL